jgi:TonB family protein
MIAIWMLYAALVGGLLVVAADALDHAARTTRLPVRFIWLAALAGAIVLPFAIPMLVAPVPSTGGVTIGAAWLFDAGFTDAAGSQRGPIALLRELGSRLDQPLMLAWLLLSVALLGRVVIAIARLVRERDRWIPREIDGTPLFVTPDVGPAVVAIPDSRIVLPEWVLSLDAASLSTVVRHEREHRAAGDARVILGGSLAAALFPWNPAVWYMRRRLRLAVEMDCDARVLAHDSCVEEYGSLLLAIAQRPRRSPYFAATLAESASDLERRIDAMTAPPPRRPRARAGALLAAAAAAIFVACSMDAPEVPSAVASTAQKTRVEKPYFDFQIEQPAAVISSAFPKYPAALRAANVEGQVIAQFVVDTTGRVDVRTFEVKSSDHDEFTAAVADALPALRFSPARVGGHPVKQLVRMPFMFSLSNRGSSPGASIRR